MKDVRVLASSAWPKSTSTVNSLYEDILLSIFFCVHQKCITSSDYDSVLTTRLSPWVLSHVCRHWRAIVVSAPRLWTDIYLDMDRYISHPSAYPLRLEIVLQRSRDLDLGVEIQETKELSGPQGISDETRACNHSIVRLLRPTTARWRRLELTSSRGMFDALTGCSFERLRSLAIYYCLDVREEEAPITIFRHATKLVELTCQDEVDIDIPRAGIRTFSTGCRGLSLLPGMTGLQKLDIDDRTEDIEGLAHVLSKWEGIQSFELPLLRTITVREGDKNPVIYELSRRLRVPSLMTLLLNMWNHTQNNPSAPRLRFPAFDDLSSLINLAIEFLPFKETNIPFLTLTSSVTNLYLGPNAAAPAVMEAIALGAVPKLNTLGLHPSTWKNSQSTIISMLTRRALDQSPIPVLRFARFSEHDEFSAIAREELDELEEWLPDGVRRVRKGNAAAWAVVQRSTDVKIVKRYRF